MGLVLPETAVGEPLASTAVTRKPDVFVPVVASEMITVAPNCMRDRTWGPGIGVGGKGAPGELGGGDGLRGAVGNLSASLYNDECKVWQGLARSHVVGTLMT